MPTFRQDVKLGTKVPLIKKDDIDNLIIEESDIADGAVTTPKIADGSVTKDKLSKELQSTIDDVGGKIDKDSIVQSVGVAKDKVMSQKAVTDELNGIHDTTDYIISVMVKKGFNIDLASSAGWTFTFRSITQTSSDGTFLPFTTLSIVAMWYAQEVTSKIYNIAWTRDSGNKESDEAWNKAHTNNKLELPITYDDLGGNAYVMGKVNFTCTAGYDADGEWQKTQKTVCF